MKCLFYLFSAAVLDLPWLVYGNHVAVNRNASNDVINLRHRHSFNHDLLQSGEPAAVQFVSAARLLGYGTSVPELARFVVQSQSQHHRVVFSEHLQVNDDPHFLPNISDKLTVVNLAKMTSDSYLLEPGKPGWYNTSLGFNFTKNFGWKEDGLRGHVFTTEENDTVVVSFKGTTINPLETSPRKDRLNDIQLFSCCCGSQQPYHYSPVCNCSTGYYECDSSCLTCSVLQNDTYYNAAMDIMFRTQVEFPGARLWVVGHSLGGSLASLVGLTLNIPSVSFEAPPERLPAQRMGLLPEGLPQDSNHTMAHHFGNTADPVYMGACNGFFSSCSLWGFSFESQCHSGRRCVYDTVQDKGWHSSITNHRINYVIENVLEVYDTVPICEEDLECQDCFNWKFS